LSLIKQNGGKKIKKNYLIKIGRFGRTALYVIRTVILEAQSNICVSYSLVPLAPSVPDVCLGIMFAVTLVSKVPFLVDKIYARRLSNDATGLRHLDT